MRAVNYLNEQSSILGVDVNTLKVIDRSLAEAGLRAKGVGRSIPEPTLREELMLMLAANSGFPSTTAAEGARFWAEMPFQAHIGSRSKDYAGLKLIEVLEAILCEWADAADKKYSKPVLELSHTRKQAFIDLPQDSHRNPLVFGTDVTENTLTEITAKVSSRYFERLAVQKVRGEI